MSGRATAIFVGAGSPTILTNNWPSQKPAPTGILWLIDRTWYHIMSPKTTTIKLVRSEDWIPHKNPRTSVLTTCLITGASHICKNTSSGSFLLPSSSFLLAPDSWLLTPISSGGLPKWDAPPDNGYFTGLALSAIASISFRDPKESNRQIG
jgi:hypothetical protein